MIAYLVTIHFLFMWIWKLCIYQVLTAIVDEIVYLDELVCYIQLEKKKLNVNMSSTTMIILVSYQK